MNSKVCCRAALIISVLELHPEGHILTHTDGATGVQLAAWGALTSKGASIVPADTVHARVRGALIDICRKKWTVTVVSKCCGMQSSGPGTWGGKKQRT